MNKEALKLALEALEYWDVQGKLHQPTEEAITAIKEALAQEQEPQIAFNAVVVGYVAPQRTWVGLTVEEIASCCRESTTTQLSFAQELEAKLKELNT